MECPNCKSKKLNFLPWLGIIYECRSCGWRGPLALEKKRISKISKSAFKFTRRKI